MTNSSTSNPLTSQLNELRELSNTTSALWMTTGQLAQHLKISHSSLEKARSIGNGPYTQLAYHKFGRLVRYKRTDVEAFLNAQKVVGRNGPIASNMGGN